MLLPGNGESPANYPSNQFRFRQDSTFLYFFGLNRPDYVGLMDIDSGEETLYGDDYTIDDIIWMGPQPTLDEQAREVGIGKTLPLSQLGKRIEAAVAKGRKVHFLPPYRGETTLQIARLLGLAPERVPLYASVELAKAVVALREIKDADEIDQIEKACEIGSKMHRMAMKMCRPGVVEREIAGAIESIALQHGAGVSFFSIVSQHGETLHNHCHEGTLLSGRLMLVDAGAETTDELLQRLHAHVSRQRPVHAETEGRIRHRAGGQRPHVLAGRSRFVLLSDAQRGVARDRRRPQVARPDAGRHAKRR